MGKGRGLWVEWRRVGSERVNGERREGRREREGKERMIHTNKIINT